MDSQLTLTRRTAVRRVRLELSPCRLHLLPPLDTSLVVHRLLSIANDRHPYPLTSYDRTSPLLPPSLHCRRRQILAITRLLLNLPLMSRHRHTAVLRRSPLHHPLLPHHCHLHHTTSALLLMRCRTRTLRSSCSCSVDD